MPCEIVGVIRDNEWQSLEKEVHPFYALALQQSQSKKLYSRWSAPPVIRRALIAGVRNIIRELDPNDSGR